MSNTHTTERPGDHATADLPLSEPIRLLRDRMMSENDLRRGVCLLGAGQFSEAMVAFSRAAVHGAPRKSIASLLAACHAAQGDPNAAAERYESATEQDDGDVACRVRLVLSLWSAGRRGEAISRLRDAVKQHPESGELHFQLGTLLADAEAYEEAELRFVQAINLDRLHAEAMVSLAMIYGLKQLPDEALKQLQRAQQLRPDDAKIGLLLAQAARAMQQSGRSVQLKPAMPEELAADEPGGLADLVRIVEADIDFVDALLGASAGNVDNRVFEVMHKAVLTLLERKPTDAGVHFRSAQLLDRLGRTDEAILACERAVGLDATFTKALIQLGRLYARTDRATEAVRRLEQAVRAGAAYADVYYQLGNLYERGRKILKARSAYTKALAINHDYVAARAALDSLETIEA
jgi:tetratricopeptide (TPR) repeat protein